jgi:hypothetical protein
LNPLYITFKIRGPNIVQKRQINTRKNGMRSQTRQRKQTLAQPNFTSNRYIALLEEESEDQQQKAGPENMPYPSPICINDVTNIANKMGLKKFLE